MHTLCAADVLGQQQRVRTDDTLKVNLGIDSGLSGRLLYLRLDLHDLVMIQYEGLSIGGIFATYFGSLGFALGLNILDAVLDPFTIIC